MAATGQYRSQFSTVDPDEAQDFLDRMYAARPPKVGGRADQSFPMAVSQVSVGGLSYMELTTSPEFTVRLISVSAWKSP